MTSGLMWFAIVLGVVIVVVVIRSRMGKGDVGSDEALGEIDKKDLQDEAGEGSEAMFGDRSSNDPPDLSSADPDEALEEVDKKDLQDEAGDGSGAMFGDTSSNDPRG